MRAHQRSNTQESAAGQVAQSLIDLRRTSKDAGLKTLTGLLEIAYYEAFSKAHQTEIPEDARKWVADMEKVASQL